MRATACSHKQSPESHVGEHTDRGSRSAREQRQRVRRSRRRRKVWYPGLQCLGRQRDGPQHMRLQRLRRQLYGIGDATLLLGCPHHTQAVRTRRRAASATMFFESLCNASY